MQSHNTRDEGQGARDPNLVLALADRLTELGVPGDALVPVRSWAERRMCQVAGCTARREATITLRDGNVIATCHRHEVRRDA